MAYLRNGLVLNFDFSSIRRNNWLSPFYNPFLTPQDDPSEILALAAPASVPVDLRPTLPQILIPHHAYIDLLPSPVFRAQAVLLAAAMPHLFDMLELKADTYLRGAWEYRPCAAAGGQPWDVRSWETKPWFRRKWALLFGCEGERPWNQTDFMARIALGTCGTESEEFELAGGQCETATFECPLNF